VTAAAPPAKTGKLKPERPGRPGRPSRRKLLDLDEVPEEREEPSYEQPEFTDESGIAEAFAPFSSVLRVARKKKRRKPRVEDPEALRKLRRKKKKGLRRREGRIRPSPPLQETNPLAAYLAGEMVPCPVGCGGFSEVVRVSTKEDGSGEVWFECLSCAQRRAFEVPKATADEIKAVFAASEEGREPTCPRHGRSVALRRRGRQFVCPECGVVFSDDAAAA
jgi:hypothetical protein